MDNWVLPIGAMLIALAVGTYVVRRRASDRPEWRSLRQLVTAMQAVLLVALAYLLWRSVFGVPA
jgi:hypothetical protein